MRDVGYRYVNLDAGWAAADRDRAGNLVADPQKFPSGIAALARYAHERGMLLGLYSSPYNETCGSGAGIRRNARCVARHRPPHRLQHQPPTVLPDWTKPRTTTGHRSRI